MYSSPQNGSEELYTDAVLQTSTGLNNKPGWMTSVCTLQQTHCQLSGSKIRPSLQLPCAVNDRACRCACVVNVCAQGFKRTLKVNKEALTTNKIISLRYIGRWIMRYMPTVSLIPLDTKYTFARGQYSLLRDGERSSTYAKRTKEKLTQKVHSHILGLEVLGLADAYIEAGILEDRRSGHRPGGRSRLAVLVHLSSLGVVDSKLLSFSLFF